MQLDAFVLVGLLLLVLLWAVFRFSIVSPLITSGGDDDLQTPDCLGVERLLGRRLPFGTAEFYSRTSFVPLKEFRLIGPTSTSKVWEIGQFLPLTPRHVKENQKIHGVSDLPLATDSDKGVYVLLPTGHIVHRAGDGTEPDTVASSLLEFSQFSVLADGESDA